MGADSHKLMTPLLQIRSELPKLSREILVNQQKPQTAAAPIKEWNDTPQCCRSNQLAFTKAGLYNLKLWLIPRVAALSKGDTKLQS